MRGPRARAALLAIASASALALGVGALGAGCSGVAAPAPETVAEDFWTAIRERDLETARALSTAASLRRIESLFGDRIFRSASFADALTNEDEALVATVLVGPEGADRLEFNTHLVRLDGGWRVDPEPTAADLRKASFAAALSDVQESLREGERVLSEALEQGAREASEAIRRAIEDLERALAAPPPPPPTP